MASSEDSTHPYGSGSHALVNDDPAVMPKGYVIKGNDDSMLYHRPDSRSYVQTGAEVWFASDAAARAAGFSLAGTHGDNSVEIVDPALAGAGAGVSDTHPFGSGSHAPLADAREMPGCYPIKGNDDSMLYHRPDSNNYGATVAEVWFDSPSAAEAAGFTLSSTHPKDNNPADYEPGGSGHPCSVADVAANRNTVATAVAGLAAAGAAGSSDSDDPETSPHIYGVGSHIAFDDPSVMPDGYPIKGNVDSMLYHRPDSRNYGATGAEVWFDSPSVAEAAGYSLAPTHPDGANVADFEPGGSAHPMSADEVEGIRGEAQSKWGLVGLAGLGGAAAIGGAAMLGGDDEDNAAKEKADAERAAKE
ncbi:MAG: hypothetical protein V3V01_10125, partial [Acidimicrobiales bacterium]